MNLVPHMHEIEIVTRYAGVFVVYGDTYVSVRKFFWESNPEEWSQRKMERRITATAKKAIRIHDQGTQRAARRGDLSLATDVVGDRLKIHDGPAEVWPSERLVKRR